MPLLAFAFDELSLNTHSRNANIDQLRHIIQILTGAVVNTGKLRPEVV